MGDVYIGYLNYAILLWLATGVFILRIDVKGYELMAMHTEKKVCRILGWLNVLFGLLVFAGNAII